MGEIPCRFPASREFPALETSSLLTVSSSGEPANHRSLPISRASGHRDGPRRVADALCLNALMALRETGAGQRRSQSRG